MEKILKHILRPNDKIVKYGQFNEKVALELKMTTSLFDYIEAVWNYYDGDNPYFNNWTDVEGFGYGWGWLNYEEEDWHKMMSRTVARGIDMIDLENTLYFVYENEKVKCRWKEIWKCKYRF